MATRRRGAKPPADGGSQLQLWSGKSPERGDEGSGKSLACGSVSVPSTGEHPKETRLEQSLDRPTTEVPETTPAVQSCSLHIRWDSASEFTHRPLVSSLYAQPRTDEKVTPELSEKDLGLVRQSLVWAVQLIRELKLRAETSQERPGEQTPGRGEM